MKKIITCMLSTLLLVSGYSYAEIVVKKHLKDVGKTVLNKAEANDIDKITKCEKQKKCRIYIDMTNYEEAKLVVEIPDKVIQTLSSEKAIQSYYYGIILIAKNNAISALQEFTNNKHLYKNAIASGLDTPKSRMIVRSGMWRIESMNTLIIKDNDKILNEYIFDDIKK